MTHEMKLTKFGFVRSNERMYFLIKAPNVLDLTRFPNEEEVKAKAEFGLQYGSTMKFAAIQTEQSIR